MNLILQAVIVIWLLCVVPFAMGLLLENISDKKSISVPQTFTFGYIGMFALFFIECVSAIYMNRELHILMQWWEISTIVICILSIPFFYLWIRNGKRITDSQNIEKTGCIMCMIVLTVMIISVFFAFPDTTGDIVEHVMRAVSTDTLYQYDPYSGEIMSDIPLQLKYAPWDMFFAVICKMTGIQSAILIKTIIPIFYIPVIYMGYMLWTQYLFPKRKKMQLYFFIAMSLINGMPLLMDRGYGIRVISGAFQRDTMLYSFVLPMTIWLAILYLDEKKKLNQIFFVWIGCALAAELVYYKGIYFIVLIVGITLCISLIRRIKQWRKS